MVENRAGGFEYRGRTYRFDDAGWRWSPGHLFVEAKGNRCGLSLVGVPFPGVTEVAGLPGRVWEPDEESFAPKPQDAAPNDPGGDSDVSHRLAGGGASAGGK